MDKVKITADGILSVIKSIFNDNDINIVGEENKTLQEELNINYFVFKHRPQSTEQIIAELRGRGANYNELMGLSRSFCCFTMSNVERVFTKDIDQAVIEGVLDFWIQAYKLPLIETLLDKANRALTGVRIPITFEPSGEVRKASVIFDTLGTPDIDPASQIGEAARVSVGVTIIINDLYAYNDYKLEFSTDGTLYYDVPFTFFKTAYDTVQHALSNTNLAETGILNTTSSMTFCFAVFDKPNQLNAAIEAMLFCHQATVQNPPTNIPSNNSICYLRIETPSKAIYNYDCVLLNADKNIGNTAAPIQTTLTLKPIAKI